MTSAVDSQSDPQSNSLSPTLSPNAPDCDLFLPQIHCNPAPPLNDAVETPLPLHAESLRCSTRLHSEPAAVENANAGSRKRKLPAEKEENSLRRSPRFSAGSGSGSRHGTKVCHCTSCFACCPFLPLLLFLVKSDILGQNSVKISFNLFHYIFGLQIECFWRINSISSYFWLCSNLHLHIMISFASSSFM